MHSMRAVLPKQSTNVVAIRHSCELVVIAFIVYQMAVRLVMNRSVYCLDGVGVGMFSQRVGCNP